MGLSTFHNSKIYLVHLKLDLSQGRKASTNLVSLQIVKRCVGTIMNLLTTITKVRKIVLLYLVVYGHYHLDYACLSNKQKL